MASALWRIQPGTRLTADGLTKLRGGNASQRMEITGFFGSAGWSTGTVVDVRASILTAIAISHDSRMAITTLLVLNEDIAARVGNLLTTIHDSRAVVAFQVASSGDLAVWVSGLLSSRQDTLVYVVINGEAQVIFILPPEQRLFVLPPEQRLRVLPFDQKLFVLAAEPKVFPLLLETLVFYA